MKKIFLLDQLKSDKPALIGGKGSGLLALQQAGVLVPKTVIITSEVYNCFLDTQGLRERVALELNRKILADMRWEEIWDTALRIKNLFLTTPMSPQLTDELSSFLSHAFTNTQVAVRSSSLDEDQAAASFAGLHESYLNIPVSNVIDHVKKVWASLWSDKALLYRQELGLSVETSSMAVIIQQMIDSDVAGVCFTRDPLHSNAMVVEAVYGLNQGLVDGEIEPDRWFLSRESGEISQHTTPVHRQQKAADPAAVITEEQHPDALMTPSPLTTVQLKTLWQTCLQLELKMHQSLDIEWTFFNGQLYMLQARPISTLSNTTRQDKRPWYLSLHRSYANLVDLRHTIEQKILPTMDREAADFSQIDVTALDNKKLAKEILQRMARSAHWSKVYWQDCIPFAHGVRLLGDVYNERLLPDAPYEFVLLLRQEKMLSTTRNTLLQQLAARIKNDTLLKSELESQGLKAVSNATFRKKFMELIEKFGFFLPNNGGKDLDTIDLVTKIVLEYAQALPKNIQISKSQRDQLEQLFLDRMVDSGYSFDGKQLLDLARASYRIRDDDNIYLGKIEQQAMAAVDEGRKRLTADHGTVLDPATTPEEIAALLMNGSRPIQHPPKIRHTGDTQNPSSIRPRQMIGQPASQGIARGQARIIRSPEDLMTFKTGEILVIDSIDPNMTFVVPLAAAIVEQRGGMLIHGAIIAREYGIPCITGITDALKLIKTGNHVTVDGYLGIVTVAKGKRSN